MTPTWTTKQAQIFVKTLLQQCKNILLVGQVFYSGFDQQLCFCACNQGLHSNSGLRGWKRKNCNNMQHCECFKTKSKLKMLL